MKRVTRRGGSLLVVAEPDYASRLDGPPEFIHVGKLQTDALVRRGADVTLGSHLADLVDRAGIVVRETGRIEAWPGGTPSRPELDDEWEILQDDLAGLVSAPELERLKHLDAGARSSGERTIQVPTYFAWGQV